MSSSPRPVQHFSDAYLAHCARMSPSDRCAFLDEFRRIHLSRAPLQTKRKLISMRVPEGLLAAFKARAAAEGVPYQTQIQRLMHAWVQRPGPASK